MYSCHGSTSILLTLGFDLVRLSLKIIPWAIPVSRKSLSKYNNSNALGDRLYFSVTTTGSKAKGLLLLSSWTKLIYCSCLEDSLTDPSVEKYVLVANG